MNKFGRIALKTVLWILGILVFLVVLVLILIQIPSVQNYAKNKAVTFLQNKIHTKVQINRLSIDFPKMLVLEGVYFADQKGDTLLAGDRLKVNITMMQLLHKKVEINEINFTGMTANVSRTRDSVFNFDYITKAFAGDQKKEPQPTDTTSTLKFSLDKINLDHINIKYNDAVSGNNIRFILGHFDTRVQNFDMDKMKFSVPKITLSGFDAKIVQTPSGTLDTKPDTSSAIPFNELKLGTIDLSKIHVDYSGKEMKSVVTLGKLLVDVNKLDLKKQTLTVNTIQLFDTKSTVILTKPENVKKAVAKVIRKIDTMVAAPRSGKPWLLAVNKVSFIHNDLTFDNQAEPATKGLDYMHMDIRNLNLNAENLAYNATDFTGRVNSFNFSDKSGLNVKNLHTSFLYGPKQSYLKDLYFETPQTLLQNRVEMSYPSIAALSDNMGAIHINANIVNSKVGLKDVLLLMPSMATMEPFKHSPNAVFKVTSQVSGQLNSLYVPNLDVSGLSATHVKASGTIKGLPDMNKVYFDVKIADFNTNKGDIARLVPASSIPSNIKLPNTVNARGTFKGGINSFTTNMSVRSPDGAVDAIATINMAKGVKNMTYTIDAKANDLNVGKLTGQEKNVGLVTMNLKVKGAGTDPKTANATFSGDMVKATIQGYAYQNMTFTGSADHGHISTVARMKDPNLNFSLDAKADMNKKYPSVLMTLDLDSANVQKLGFSSSELRLHGKIVADIPVADPDHLNGIINMTDLLINTKGQRIKLDSINVVAKSTADSSTLDVRSQILTAHLGGQYKLTEIGGALQAEVSKYFNIGTPNTAQVKYSPEHLNFNITVVKTPFIKQFVPDLKQLDPVAINGSFDSQQGKLVINGRVPKVVYGTNVVSNIKLAVNTNNNALNYSLTADEVKASQIDLLNTSITGSAQNNKLTTSVQVRDTKQKERYRLAGVFTAANNSYQFSFLPDGLIFDYTPWTVSSGNMLQFGGSGILARDFTISNAGQSLTINSSPPQPNAPLSIDMKNFRIETLTKLAQQNGLLAGGVVNGNVVVKNLDKSAEFTADLTINDFNFKGDTVGNVALKVNNQTANTYAANMVITGKGNQVNMDGTYDTNNSSFDLNLNIANLNIKSIEGFSFGNIKQGSGSVNGQLKITGTTTAPVVRGDLNFNKAAFNITQINSYYRAENEKVTFNADGIMFNDFTLIDSAGNKAVVTGTVYTKNFTDYKFGLDVTTNNFRVYNAMPANNKLYYGQVYLDSQLKIRGDVNRPIIDGTMKVNDKTRLTIVIPQDDPGIEDRKGVVEFVNKKAPGLDSLLKHQMDSLKKSALVGMDVSVDITTDKNAEFIIVMDARNGDVVHLKGEAQLNGGIDISGKTSLTGTYTVTEGSYDLSYATLNRKFLIKPGSTITWQGDPTLATLNVTAIYVAKVAPIDLVNNQLASETEQTLYKERLPFNIDLNLQNQLMKPDIKFDIVLPDSTYNVGTDVVNTVNAKLEQIRQDPNEMNKQVFAVLLLNHFIGQNPFQSQAGGGGVEGAVRNSVSSLLSQQLNNLAGNVIAGVDVNFALSSGQDYASGTATNRTDLNVGLSKHFLNDRLTVTVGNNFNLEGQQPGEQATNIAGDISLNYKLSADGRYMIRAYRRDQFIVIQGQVVETGVGFTLTVDYNSFGDLFKGKSKETKAMLKKQKADDKANKDKDQALQDKQTTSKSNQQ